MVRMSNDTTETTALETVVVHELAHLKVFGHGLRFWAIVANQRPSHLADRAWLRRHASELHAARLEAAYDDAEGVTADGPSWLHRWRVARKLPSRMRDEPDPPQWVVDLSKQ